MDNARTPVFYTFGNHMHWVDMEWLWGYDVLPGSIRDMIAFCSATGAKGGVNFDGIGYEKLASENPEALAELREVVQAGAIEVIGGSYGQPYGLFHGSESNIRQRVFGVRASQRLLGVRPRTFWEEEFDFFPQLPQVLRGVGIQYASLYFQWTWHTPEVRQETTPVVWWEGQDGSRLLCATRNALNIHQWPEDIEAVLADLPAKTGQDGTVPLLLQWLELMPSPDWMCRSEVLLPKTLELLADPRFEFRFGTLGEYLQGQSDTVEVRRYGMDDVFHGMSLGKNGDVFRRLSRRAETRLLSAERVASIAGFMGRPYPQWDVYPAWELDEAWRELLAAQHHDNDECEGLCGHIGRFSYERSLSLSQHVLERTVKNLASRVDADAGSLLVYNPLPWVRTAGVTDPQTGARGRVEGVPALGYAVVSADQVIPHPDCWMLTSAGARGEYDGTVVEVSLNGSITQIRSRDWPEGILREDAPLLKFHNYENCTRVDYEAESLEIDPDSGNLVVRYRHPKEGGIRVDLRLGEPGGALEVSIAAGQLPRPDAGMNSGLQTSFGVVADRFRLITDQPLGMQEVKADATYRRKYPTGDWMTSPQWFETVDNPFSSLSLVDLVDEATDRGLLIIHDRSQQWFRDEEGVRNLLTMYDPWDEDYYVQRFTANYRLIPHGPLTHGERHRRVQEYALPPVVATTKPGPLPKTFSTLEIAPSNVAMTAFYRETEVHGRGFEGYAGEGLGHPYVLRLLEFDGKATEIEIPFRPTIAKAVRTNLLGEPEGVVESTPHSLRLTLKPYEIATVYLDLVEGRKVVRDLDAHRNVWATVHRDPA